jgi:xylan 1,4-beta-xylosidase
MLLSVGTLCGLEPAPAYAQDYQLSVNASNEIGTVNRFWQSAVGSTHMYMVLESGTPGVNLQSAYRLAARELGVQRVRGHGILNDDVGIYSEVNGQPVYNWENYDQIIDYIVSLGMDPLIELSFMPSALATGDNTFGWYNGAPGNITLPSSWERWRDLIYNIAAHSIERYGEEEVESWYWEVWNEPDLPRGDFFVGTIDDYFTLYDYAVDGLMQADPDLRVGGPSVAISGNDWIDRFIDHCMQNGKKVDFISWHTYPNFRADPGAVPGAHRGVQAKIDAKMAQYPGLQLENLLTEWNTTYRGGSTFHHEIGASFVAKTVHDMFQSQNNGVKPPDTAAFWVISDLWEEWQTDGLGFDVMGMVMRRNDVRKPTYLAFQMMAWMHHRQLQFSGGSSDARGLNGWATISDNGQQVQVLIYDHNFVSSTEADADFVEPVTHQVSLQLTGIPFTGPAVVERYGVDRIHNNAYWVAANAGNPLHPSDETWAAMQTAGQLNPIQPSETIPLSAGSLNLNFEQLQPGVSLFLITQEGVTVLPPIPDPNAPSNPSAGGSSTGGTTAGAAGGTALAGGGMNASGGTGTPSAPFPTGGMPTAPGVGGSGVPPGSAPPDGIVPGAETSGCGCQMPGRPDEKSSALLALGLFALVTQRRRTRAA